MQTNRERPPEKWKSPKLEILSGRSEDGNVNDRYRMFFFFFYKKL